MTTSIWRSLVVETQFATELALTGLRRLCSVPTGPATGIGSTDHDYSLHVGMYSYSSGLERLCKLAISCHGYVTTGEFTNVRPYLHKIGKLLNAVEVLAPVGPGLSKREGRYLVRPVDRLDPDLTDTIERFASGAGRYEHLDSLRDKDAEVSTHKEWSALAAKAPVSAEVRKLVSLKYAATTSPESRTRKSSSRSCKRCMNGSTNARQKRRMASPSNETRTGSLCPLVPLKGWQLGHGGITERTLGRGSEPVRDLASGPRVL
ncbi:hypothetical protein [Sinomonas gamaensis]|uniref:hypothetical protein n=1 Tax=Sinomonas gamaensis TaxID=2565624 RepID=UPI001109FADA|nr:hypothetical protein [Sinomonas gamaensis]